MNQQLTDDTRTDAASAPAEPPTPTTTRRNLWARLTAVQEIGVGATLLVMVAVIGVLRPNFATFDSLTNVAGQAAFFGIMALGMVFLLSMREIDLSVGSLYSLSAVFCAVLVRDGLSAWTILPVATAVGIAGGAFNGALTILFRIPSIIATLGTLSMYRGLSLVLSDSRAVGGLPRDHAYFEWFGGEYLNIPAIIWAFGLLTLLLSIIYKRGRFGFVVRAIGSNPESAEAAGLDANKARLKALILAGALGGFCGGLTVAFFQSADPGLGTGFEILAIASAIIGGTTLAGGVGSVLGAALGALIIGTIRSGLVQFGVTSSWSQFATGAVIVGAVALDSFIRRRRDASAERASGLN